MVDAEPAPPPEKKNSDLVVRLISAAVMLAILAAAVSAGGRVFDLFVLAVAAITFVEFILLVVKATDNVSYRLAAILAGTVYIGLAGWVLAGLDQYFLLAALGSVIATDTGAYFVGRAIGGPKIAKSISPSKTWAGLLGGMFFAGLFIAGMAFAFHYIGGAPTVAEVFTEEWSDLALAFVVGAVLAIAAQAGDFFESWLKRKAGVKDSSRLIPGHGGVFDRVDGLLPVALIVGSIGMTAY